MFTNFWWETTEKEGMLEKCNCDCFKYQDFATRNFFSHNAVELCNSMSVYLNSTKKWTMGSGNEYLL